MQINNIYQSNQFSTYICNATYLRFVKLVENTFLLFAYLSLEENEFRVENNRHKAKGLLSLLDF